MQRSSTNSLTYFTLDLQGSLLALTENAGNLVEERNYDAWGRPRNPSTLAYTLANPFGGSSSNYTLRCYTFHEHLEEFDLINMNGRMYDTHLAKFLNADPLLQDYENSQNYNRYSYVLNNPLKYTDPTGYAGYSNAGISGISSNAGSSNNFGSIGETWHSSFSSMFNELGEFFASEGGDETGKGGGGGNSRGISFNYSRLNRSGLAGNGTNYYSLFYYLPLGRAFPFMLPNNNNYPFKLDEPSGIFSIGFAKYGFGIYSLNCKQEFQSSLGLLHCEMGNRTYGVNYMFFDKSQSAGQFTFREEITFGAGIQWGAFRNVNYTNLNTKTNGHVVGFGQDLNLTLSIGRNGGLFQFDNNKYIDYSFNAIFNLHTDQMFPVCFLDTKTSQYTSTNWLSSTSFGYHILGATLKFKF
ncbi:MAG: hypothetical protein CFE21_10535 [Bacteroidetes bacterium B1(2017)]|nr:MAG: hypothetical protein CFE21_10535 [Bacteroidetes bacterium B1(2017)]